MKKISIFLFFFGSIFLLAETYEQTITNPDEGQKTIFSKIERELVSPLETITARDQRVELIFQTSDPAAIAGEISVSEVSQNSFVGWYLNDERASLYHQDAVPVWEHVVGDLDFGYSIDMMEDGDILAIGDGTELKILAPDSSVPIWQHSCDIAVSELALEQNGDYIFTSHYDEIQERSTVQCFTIGEDDPVWSQNFVGSAGTLTLSGDGSTLIFTQYGGGNSAMWVMESLGGTIIFEGPEHNQNPPAISYDGSLIVNGDYSGYVYVYQYDDNYETYEEIWNYHVTGGGSSDWIGGMSISADGSTIAIGTLTFVTNSYNGQIYLFNSYSPEPIWIYENVGDYVIDIDMNNDGSLIAAASYGPLDHSTADFLLFRRETNVPVFEINTSGSMFFVDMTENGEFCTVGGKAVHAREMGSGGLLYSIDCDLGGGHISGRVDLEGTDDNSGVKAALLEIPELYTFTDSVGDFSIMNIPAGTFNVEYTKVGYQTNYSANVEIVDGETTILDEVTLFSTGVAPSFLNATNGLNETVQLFWEDPDNALEINIYRKNYEQEAFPENPLATVSNNTEFYADSTALPMKEYFYAVTAVYNIGESPYSNIDIGWINANYIVDEISVYEGSTPTIDGTISPGEWDDAYVIDCSDHWGTHDGTTQPIGSVIGYFKRNPEMTELYVAFQNFNDAVLEDHDEVALYIDDNNDGTYPPVDDDSEGNYWAAYYQTGNQLRYRPIYETGGAGDFILLDDPQLEVSNDEGYLVYEFVIPFGTEDWQINSNDQNESGIGIFVLDDNAPDPNGFDGWWPLDNLDLFSPEDYGTINFDPIPEIPPAPTELNVEMIPSANLLELTWQMPQINDLDHFNVFLSIDEQNFQFLSETDGTSHLYQLDPIYNESYRFYVTTVNQAGMESEPSEIVEILLVETDDIILPKITKLEQNFPNPFNPETKVRFQLAENSQNIELAVFNIRGQKVKTLKKGKMAAGNYEVTWQGKDQFGKKVASGIYFYRLQSEEVTKIRKMLLLK